MILAPQPPRILTSGIVWPREGTTAPEQVRAVFGPRRFAPHVETTGFDYDFHRGIDIVLELGGVMRSPVNGRVIRAHMSHFEWETDQLYAFDVSDPHDQIEAAVVGEGGLQVSVAPGDARGTAFPDDAALILNKLDWVNPAGDGPVPNLDVQMRFAGVPTLGGELGIAVTSPDRAVYALLGTDGATTFFRSSSFDGGSWASSDLWLRMRYVVSNETMHIFVSADGRDWAELATRSGSWPSSVAGRPTMRAGLYYMRKGSTAAESATVRFNGAIHNETIGRFGNWVAVGRSIDKWLVLHLRDLAVRLGQTVRAGQPLGTMGLTGYSDRSGQILFPHVHLERVPSNAYIYDNDEPRNPLHPGLLPRVDVQDNVTVTRTEENDPDDEPSHRLRIRVAREDQDFDLDYVRFVGSTATREIRWDTREGLHEDNDIPVHDGVYIAVEPFDEESAEYEVSLFFHQGVVGTFASAEVRDAAGTVLWSEGV